MLPILLQIGPFTIYSFGFVLGLGFLLAIFVAWRRLKEIGLAEEKILDCLILASVSGAFASWGIFHLQNPFYRGISLTGGLAGALIVIYLFCRKEKWNFWQVADELAYCLAPFGVIFSIGLFLDGSGAGRPTSMPWGIFLPGELFKTHPVSLFSAISLFAGWLTILLVERNWRGWEILKNKGYGFIFLIFSFFFFIGNIVVVFLSSNDIYWHYLKIGANSIAALIVFILLILRFNIWPKSLKKKQVSKNQ